MSLLGERGAEVEYHDPYVPVIKPTREHPHFVGKKSVESNRTAIQNFDLVLIATNHSCVNYQELGDWANVSSTLETPWHRCRSRWVRFGRHRFLGQGEA